MWMWIFIIALALIAVAAGMIWLRSVQTGQSVGGLLFGPKPDKRLGVLEMTPVDGRRRLVLVRRDDVEHLIMIGGPVDVVIETSIGAPLAVSTARPRGFNSASANGAAPEPAPAFGRQARNLSTPPAGPPE